MPTASSISLVRNAEVDPFAEELLQYAIKDFLSFLKYYVTSILKGTSFASTAISLNHYVVGIESIGGK